MKKKQNRGRLLMNTGGLYQRQVRYSQDELDEIWNYLNWRDPLKSTKRTCRLEECIADTSGETPLLPNWSYISKRNLWSCHYAGTTMVVSQDLIGAKWALYLEGEVKIGESGTLEEMKDRGTALLIYIMVERNSK